jgi:hypothetical protein
LLLFISFYKDKSLHSKGFYKINSVDNQGFL